MDSLTKKHAKFFKDIAKNGKSLMAPFAGEQLADAAHSLAKLSSLGTIMDDATSTASLVAEALRPPGSALRELMFDTEGGNNLVTHLPGVSAPLLSNQQWQIG